MLGRALRRSSASGGSFVPPTPNNMVDGDDNFMVDGDDNNMVFE